MSRCKNLKIAIATLGCKVNQYESASFSSSFTARGAELVPFNGRADVYVINTCAVTNHGGVQSRKAIRQAIKKNPKARIVVTGCYSQIAGLDIIEMMDQPVCLVGNGHKQNLVDIALNPEYCDLEMHMTDIGTIKECGHLPVIFPSTSSQPDGHIAKQLGRSRAQLKLQDGCNNFCAYCIVPFSRGRSRSVMPELALGQARMFAKAGYKEIVLTGIHVGMYGKDLDADIDLGLFIDQVTALNPTTRFRLSSLEPNELTDEILVLFNEKENLMNHLHIPLQSGDSEILERMGRTYTAEEFESIIVKAHGQMPDAAMGIDVLVGFPGETEEQFNNTYELLKRLPVTYFHVFPYSRRPGTRAAAMEDQLSGAVKSARVQKLRGLDLLKKETFYSRFVGTSHRVLAENRTKEGLMRGFSENYIPVLFKAPVSVRRKVVEVMIERVEGTQVYGRMVNP
jgi:threonylcarbamoyladenosine tRNA methylthiotransferase MtaB